MDYSLLIGVVRRKFGVVDLEAGTLQKLDNLGQDENGAFHAATVEGPGSYYMGIIDILQEWNFEKKLERFLKIYFKREDPDGLSAIRPDLYQERFMQRAVNEVFEGLDGNESDVQQSAFSENTSKKSRVDRRFSVTPISKSPTAAGTSVMSPFAEEAASYESRVSSKGSIQNESSFDTRVKSPSVHTDL
jgi:hypothetical protein